MSWPAPIPSSGPHLPSRDCRRRGTELLFSYNITKLLVRGRSGRALNRERTMLADAYSRPGQAIRTARQVSKVRRPRSRRHECYLARAAHDGSDGDVALHACRAPDTRESSSLPCRSPAYRIRSDKRGRRLSRRGMPPDEHRRAVPGGLTDLDGRPMVDPAEPLSANGRKLSFSRSWSPLTMTASSRPCSRDGRGRRERHVDCQARLSRAHLPRHCGERCGGACSRLSSGNGCAAARDTERPAERTRQLSGHLLHEIGPMVSDLGRNPGFAQCF